MTYGFFDYWENLNDGFEEHNLSALTQLVGYKLLAEFNKAKFSGITLTDRELQAITNIHSLKSIHDAKAQLKQYGLIDFKTKKNKPTIYTLCEPVSKHEVNTKETQSKHEVNTAYNNNSNNNSTEDNKTLRQRDIEKKEKNAHTRTSNSDEDIKEDVRAGYFGLSLEAKLQEKWETSTRNSNRNLDGKLTDYEFTRLAKLQEKYGVEKLEKAMDKALGYNNAGLNHLERTLEELTAEHKGEMKNGRSSRIGNNVTAKNRRNAWDD